jgi:predicted SprT family Zn-dependent metalloprotease
MQFDFLKQFFAPEPKAPPRVERKPEPPPAAPPPPEPLEQKRPEVVRVPVPPIEDLRAVALKLLRDAGATTLAGKLVLRWNPRLRNTAGMAFPGRHLITLNPRLAIFGDEEIDRTLRHELAHLLAQDRVGRRRIDPHGKEWKQACADIGLAGEKRTHDLPLPRHRVQPRHFYKCPGCGFELKRVRPLRRNSACVKCCRAHNRGRYDARFRFVPAPPSA